MIFRCPYCQHEMGEEKHPLCPACGKKMRYAERRTPAQRREDKRKIRLMEKEAVRKRSAFDVEKTANLLRNPRVAIWAVFVLALLGFMLYKASSGQYNANTSARQTTAERHLRTLANALARYRFHTGQWPPANTGLMALIQDDGTEGWFGPYLANWQQLPVSKVVNDPWGQPYAYALDARTNVVLFSAGPDKTEGTADDIHADPAAFVITDWSWTNEWVSAEERLPIRVNIMPPRR